jgi:hypothetical protein
MPLPEEVINLMTAPEGETPLACAQRRGQLAMLASDMLIGASRVIDAAISSTPNDHSYPLPGMQLKGQLAQMLESLDGQLSARTEQIKENCQIDTSGQASLFRDQMVAATHAATNNELGQ